MLETQLEFAKKAMYATVGAPVVVGRAVRQYGNKVAATYGTLTDKAEAQFNEFAVEGEKLTRKFQDGEVVEEIQSRVDLEKVQDRVEKLRDQLEGALQSWRESFTPTDTRAAEKVTVEKPAAEKTTAKTTAAKKPAAKKTTTRATAAKKPAAKKTTAKTTAAK